MPVSITPGVSNYSSASNLPAIGVSSLRSLVNFILSQINIPVAFAASTRRLSNAYTGPLIRVRRSSDNLELDIPFTTDGDLDESVLISFVTTYSAFVTKVYDQSGNARDLTQTTAANQPRIVNAGLVDRIVRTGAGIARPGYVTDGVDDSLNTGDFTVAQPFSRSSVIGFLDPRNANQPVYLDVVIAGGTMALVSRTDGTLQLSSVGVVAVASGLTNTSTATIVELVSQPNSFASYNGGLGAAGSISTTSIRGLLVGNLNSASRYSNAIYSDIIIFPSKLSDSDRIILEANQKKYYGTP